MFKVVTKDNQNELWASGFFSKEKAQERIDNGYFHKNMYDEDQHKTLIVVQENHTK